MNSLPKAVLTQIFYPFSLKERLRLRLVNKKFKETIENGLKIVSHIKIGQCDMTINVNKKYILIVNFSPYTCFWSLIDRYCDSSIHIYCNHIMNLESFLPISSKIESIYFGVFETPKNFPYLLRSCFPRLQVLVSIYDQHFCCTNVLAKERIKLEESVVHMSLPCNEINRPCWSLRDQIPFGLKSLLLDFTQNLKLATISRDVTSSLVQLTIKGTAKENIFKGNFNSLRQLELIHFNALSSVSNFNGFLLKLSRASNIQFIKIDIQLNQQAADLLSKYLINLTNLTKVELNIQTSQLTYQDINLTSLQLETLFVSTNTMLSLKLSSTKLTHVTINAESLIDFKMNFSSLKSFNIERTNISCHLLQGLNSNNQLKVLQIGQCDLPSNVVIDLFNKLKHLKAVETINITCRKYAKLINPDSISINFSNHPSLNKLHLELDYLIFVNMDRKVAKSLLFHNGDPDSIHFCLTTVTNTKITVRLISSHGSTLKFGEFILLDTLSIDYKKISKSLKKDQFKSVFSKMWKRLHLMFDKL